MNSYRGLRASAYVVVLLGLALPAFAAITDADMDNMDDTWEQANGLNLTVDDSGDDLDSDTFSNLAEYRLGSNPQDALSLPPQLGNYSESFEAAPPAFWFSPGNPSTYAFDWVWDNSISTDGAASLRATQGSTDWSAANDVTIAMVVNVADSFMSLDYKLLTGDNGYCSFECWSFITYALGEFVIRVDGAEVYRDKAAENSAWINLDQLFLPAGEHLIEFVFDGIRNDSGVGFTPYPCSMGCLTTDSMWIDALQIVEAAPTDTIDTDGDGLTDYDEAITHGTNHRVSDTDNDGIGDNYEVANALDPLVSDANLDADADGFNNLFESRAGSRSDDAGSIPPLVSNYTESFDAFAGGTLPASWFIPGNVLTRAGVTVQASLEHSGWEWKDRDTLSQLITHPPTGDGGLYYPRGGYNPTSTDIGLVVNISTASYVAVQYAKLQNYYFCGLTLQVDGQSVWAPIADLSYSGQLSAYLTPGPHTITVKGASFVDDGYGGWVCSPEVYVETLNILEDSSQDSDTDGLTDTRETLITMTNPAVADTDSDGLSDGDEVNTRTTNPLDADSDDDTLTDGQEVLDYSTNPKVKDTDGDGVNDNLELASGLDPLDPADIISATDWDGDLYPNVIEQLYGTSVGNAADHPLPHPFVDGRLESFEAPFDTAVWNLGLWRTATDDAIHGVRSLKAASNSSTAKLTVNARAGTRLYFRFNNGEFTLKINGTTRSWTATGPATAGWFQIAEPVAGSYWGTPGIPLATGVNVIEFTASYVRIDEIRFAVTDTDADGMGDLWETESGLNPSNPADQSLDSDSDGLPALDELLRGTDPANPDTDDDGLADGAESAAGRNPLRPDVGTDTDGDGLLDSAEVLIHRTEPYIADTDYDSYSDGFEVSASLNPLSSGGTTTTDTDSDRYPNLIELLYGTGLANAYSRPPIPVYVDGLSESFEPTVDVTPWDLSGGGSNWVITNTAAIDGSYSLRSTSIATTSAVFTVNTRAGTNMHFRFRADDLVNRGLEVRVNGQSTWTNASGTGWLFAHAYALPAGANRVEFRYSGRAAGKPAVGCDCVYIDAIQFDHFPDYDQDGMSNAWETENSLNDNNAADAALDNDGDGLTALAEYRGGADPRAWDTDGDTLADGMDIGAGFNPRQNDLLVDSDNDGVSNATEVRNGTDPNDSNSLPPLLGSYFESFEEASPPFWFSPGGSGPEDLDWQWTPLTATDGLASIVGATGPLEPNKRPNVSMLVRTADSFMSFDYSAANNAAWPGCGAADCTVDAEFSVTVDDTPMYVIKPTGVIDWTRVGGVFLPAGEHLIEFGLTSPACVGAACSNAQTDDVAQAWLDSLLIKPADPADETDSDGDSVTDYDEVYQYHTDPMFPDIVCEDPANPPDGKLFNEDCDTGCHP